MKLTQPLTRPLTRKLADLAPSVLARGGTAPVIFPWPGAAVDLDFVRRQYWWGGALRTEGNFTTLVLNGAVWGPQGLDFSTCSANPSVTITLATLAVSFPPLTYAFGAYGVSAPAAGKTIWEIDNATNAERLTITFLTTPIWQAAVIHSSVSEATSNCSGTGTMGVRHGVATSVALNDVKGACNGTGFTADSAAVMPTGLTTLRLGGNTAAASFAPAIMSRLFIFAAVKTQAELNQLSIDIRDAT